MVRRLVARLVTRRAVLSTQAQEETVSQESKLVHPRELEFLLKEFVDLDAVLSLPKFAHLDAETAHELIRAGHALAEDVFAPANPVGDRNKPVLQPTGDVTHPEAVVAAQHAYAANGYLSMTLSEEWGGLGLPLCLSGLVGVPFSCANTALMSYHGLTAGVLKLLLAHGTEAQQQEWIPRLGSGECYGTMCLSESHAGSSLTDIRAKATPVGDGTYSIKGAKMWITGGDHSLSESIVHMVLAKLPGAPPGVKGISLFLVPKHLYDAEDGNKGTKNDVKLGGLNNKMGQNASTNAGELLFGDDTGGAVGYLVGPEHQGLNCMFTMMNELRVSVGLGAAGTAVAGYTAALQYARARPQGRDPADKDPQSPMLPIIAHSDVKRMLLAARSYAEGGMALCVYGAQLVDRVSGDAETAAEDALVLDLLIPLIKSWPSEWGLEANKLAIQVHGGAGYVKDYIVEQLYRDARVNMIYEGTNGIQSLDLLGRKIPRDNGASLKALATRIAATVADARERGRDCPAFADSLEKSTNLVAKTTMTLLKCAATGDVTTYLANSHDYMQMTGHLVVAWMWLKQAVIAADALDRDLSDVDQHFYLGKLHTARYFFKHELVKIDALARICASLDDTHPSMKNEWFF